MSKARLILREGKFGLKKDNNKIQFSINCFWLSFEVFFLHFFLQHHQTKFDSPHLQDLHIAWF
ncbi:MAG: hypothetical protein A2887_02890 [Alphaproteobacteria bacterium RIFCSPLOWO2_01_FULL_40_26]|nr:MAG: hypothetical protein A3D15_02645 [Alphaproteobacteria bacterium RIFCSPHIGHO2_02_FULL_40_34]OFW86347.1 MAG: hypothetical protein A2794_03205 [Alphaproteobacteria bacterium RIFCSPHIGHO2_01_FULL_40_8]OFW95109.1 MAG: hypothetical protein A2887_02890 [Alphaproteobacteria bacterium RIFCSPLOWO2_01_FULL_40_26]OFX09068.1 MAG: hypothetical protein A3H30_03460 [Alphaproteobacteria bacterium RIFCSPLOWO2_02_FULL_40_19]OFX10711.1 MAG: hypothetical protein A3G22_03320 [Alphaproteobacteria bacterium RI